jgi:hypothetical protein
MNMPFIPESFDVPQEFKTKAFLIRKLKTSDTYLDYIAVMSSIDIIKKTRGGDWPFKTIVYTNIQLP